MPREPASLIPEREEDIGTGKRKDKIQRQFVV